MPSLLETHHSARGRRWPSRAGRGGSLRYQSAHEHWVRYCAAAGVDATLHRLRHTHATELVNAGVSLATIRKRLGHRNLKTTLRYAEQSDAVADAEARAWRRRVPRDIDVWLSDIQVSGTPARKCDKVEAPGRHLENRTLSGGALLGLHQFPYWVTEDDFLPRFIRHHKSVALESVRGRPLDGLASDCFHNLDSDAAASLGQTQRQMILGIEHPRITGVRGEEQQLPERDEPRIAPSSKLNNVVNLLEHYVRLREADLLVAHASVSLRPAFLRFRRHAPRAPG